MYSEQFGHETRDDLSPSAVAAGAPRFDFRSHPADIESIVSRAVGHQQVLHGVGGLNPNQLNDDDLSEDYDDIDDEEYEDDDEQLNGDDSSQGELDE
jgi:hypothetical protein